MPLVEHSRSYAKENVIHPREFLKQHEKATLVYRLGEQKYTSIIKKKNMQLIFFQPQFFSDTLGTVHMWNIHDIKFHRLKDMYVSLTKNA